MAIGEGAGVEMVAPHCALQFLSVTLPPAAFPSVPLQEACQTPKTARWLPAQQDSLSVFEGENCPQRSHPKTAQATPPPTAEPQQQQLEKGLPEQQTSVQCQKAPLGGG